MTPAIKPRHAVLLAAITSAFPTALLGAPAARIDFAAGNVVAQSTDGSSRPLSRGSSISPGESILTNNGQAQMRFTDGALVSLKPGSEFRVDDYQFNGQPDGQEKGFFSLLKGGMRTITGWIGRGDREKYRVKTVTATIGIRGTEYSVTYGNSINVNTADGVVEVCNPSGCLLLYPGDEGYVADANTEPVLVQTGEEKPKKDDTPPELTDFEAPPSDRDPDGVTRALGGLLTGTDIYSVAWGHVEFGAQAGLATGQLGTIDGSGTLRDFDAGAFSVASGSAISDGNDGIVAWGRWIGSFTNPITVNTNTFAEGTLHYVAGLPAMDDPTTLPNARYSVIGGSASNGSFNTTSLSGSMNVSFSSLQVNSLNIGFSLGGTGYSISGGTPYPINAGSGLTFSGSADLDDGFCTGCPSASINGTFFGSGASRAGVSFSDDSNLAGVAAFAKN